MHHLKGFRTYQLALELHQACTEIKAPAYARDQLLRASLSVALNLSEGSGKSSPKDKARFYDIAMGSLRETQSLLMILKREQEFELSDQLGAWLYKLIRNTR